MAHNARLPRAPNQTNTTDTIQVTFTGISDDDASGDEDNVKETSTNTINTTNGNNYNNANQFPMQGSPQIVGGRTAVGTARKKVPLAPGHSAMDRYKTWICLDWGRLKASGVDIRGGVTAFKRYTPSEVASHKSKDDLWIAIQGKIYCCTYYLAYHPGGVGQLMRGAGKDATDLFFKVHPVEKNLFEWVNLDYILGDACLVGYLIPESMKQLRKNTVYLIELNLIKLSSNHNAIAPENTSLSISRSPKASILPVSEISTSNTPGMHPLRSDLQSEELEKKDTVIDGIEAIDLEKESLVDTTAVLRLVPKSNTCASLLRITCVNPNAVVEQNFGAGNNSDSAKPSKYTVSILQVNRAAIPNNNSLDTQIKRTYQFDYCVDEKIPADEFCQNLNIKDIVSSAAAGKRAAIFTASVGKNISQHERRLSIFKSAFSKLMSLVNKEDKIFFGYFGVTDSKVMDLITERNIPTSSISSDMALFLSPLLDISVVEDLIGREYDQRKSRIYFQHQDSLEKFHTTSLFSQKFAQISWPADNTCAVENEHALDFLMLTKKIRSLETVSRVDHRVYPLENKCVDLESELAKLKDINITQTKSLAATSSRINDLEILLTETRASNFTQIAQLTNLQHQKAAELKNKYDQEIAEINQENNRAFAEMNRENLRALEALKADLERKHADELNTVIERMETQKKIIVANSNDERLIDSQESAMKNEGLVLQIEKLENQICSYEIDALNLRDRIVNEEAKNAALRDSLFRLVVEKDCVSNELSALTAAFKVTTDSHQTLDVSLQSSQDIIENYARKQTQDLSFIANLKDQIMESATELKNSQKLLTEMNTTVAYITTEKAEQVKEIEILKETIISIKKLHKEALASLVKQSEENLRRELKKVTDSLHADHTAELDALTKSHQESIRATKREASKFELDSSSAAQTRIDEIETKLEEMKRVHAREIERCKRQARVDVDEDLKDLKLRVEEAEHEGACWKRDIERLQKALHRSIELGKTSLEEYEKEIDAERDLWVVEKTNLKTRNQALELKLVTISETLKATTVAQSAAFSDDVRKSILIASDIQPSANEPEETPVTRKRARLSDVSDLLEISADIGKSIPKKKSASVRATTKAAKSAAALSYETVSATQVDNESLNTEYEPEKTTILTKPRKINAETSGTIVPENEMDVESTVSKSLSDYIPLNHKMKTTVRQAKKPKKIGDSDKSDNSDDENFGVDDDDERKTKKKMNTKNSETSQPDKRQLNHKRIMSATASIISDNSALETVREKFEKNIALKPAFSKKAANNGQSNVEDGEPAKNDGSKSVNAKGKAESKTKKSGIGKETNSDDFEEDVTMKGKQVVKLKEKSATKLKKSDAVENKNDKSIAEETKTSSENIDSMFDLSEYQTNSKIKSIANSNKSTHNDSTAITKQFEPRKRKVKIINNESEDDALPSLLKVYSIEKGKIGSEDERTATNLANIIESDRIASDTVPVENNLTKKPVPRKKKMPVTSESIETNSGEAKNNSNNEDVEHENNKIEDDKKRKEESANEKIIEKDMSLAEKKKRKLSVKPMEIPDSDEVCLFIYFFVTTLKFMYYIPDNTTIPAIIYPRVDNKNRYANKETT
ncbi:hypothetical protein HK100_010806 [Physocladia obscura]|uniref:Cytochrome b5 heme-binding domain-containing protein n=1 Tax=Physocladia obscura TaxID=109957 RepID=A0AAD5XH00_9FUNG|nr:hypothetical protein HK100_010806 [Physocladia obscura]